MSGYIGTQPVPQATQTRDAFTATAGQTSFATSGYTPSFLDVYLNGIKLAAADYTASNGSDVVLASGAATGDILEVVAYTTFEVVTDTVTNAGTVLNLDRTGSDGTILDLKKDGSTVGSIGTEGSWGSGPQFLGSNSRGFIIANPNTSINEIIPNVDTVGSLGNSSNRWNNLYLSGGVYLGGTGSANKLDDYETGTFTPIIDPTGAAGSGTYTNQQGSYVKVGDVVHINIRLGWSAHTGTGGMRITGLPFTSSNAYGGLSVSYRDGLTISSGHTCNVAVIPSNTTAYVYEISTGTDNASLVAMDSVVADISISGTYTVA